jgi:predicted anti-sigma-YlaC factor YlaD
MKCEQIAGLLPDYLQGNLTAEQRNTVEEHVAQCAECRDDVAVWNKLALLPAEEPSLASRERFDVMLQAYRSGREDRVAGAAGRERGSFWDAFRWMQSPVGAAAWSMALVVLGVFIGVRVSAPDSHKEELNAMHTELANMRQMVALSMLQQQSASGRLEGVTWTRREERLDPQVLSALLHTLRFDPSVDVRLAALDALSRYAAAQPQLRSSVADALQEQQSPLVQVALIDQLVEWRDRQAAGHLEKLRQDPNVNPTVRQRADWAIRNLN